MIIAKTTCCDCGRVIELDDIYGWTKKDNNKKWIICDICEEGGENDDEY